MDKSVFTLALGKKVYHDMAVALARSFRVWHRDNDIQFYIVTDNQNCYPEDIKNWCRFIPINKGELGDGFSPKLHLDRLAPTRFSLFIDADCLIVRNIDSVFDKFYGHSVSVVGGYIAEGEWFGDVASVLRKFDLEKMPKFNGGIYYVEPSQKASEVYAKARELEKVYDEIGFTRLRNKPNDEVLMALAMQLHNQTPIEEDGSIMSDPQACPGGTYMDVFKGESLLINPPKGHPKHTAWYPFSKVSSAVVHFLGYYTSKYPYLGQTYILKLVFEKGYSIGLARLQEITLLRIPYMLKEGFKDIFRPIFRILFGYRAVRKSERI